MVELRGNAGVGHKGAKSKILRLLVWQTLPDCLLEDEIGASSGS